MNLVGDKVFRTVLGSPQQARAPYQVISFLLSDRITYARDAWKLRGNGKKTEMH